MNYQTKVAVLGTTLAAIILVCSITAFGLLTPRAVKPSYIAGRPLLGQEGQIFTDQQISLQFMPPPRWSMQERTAASPNVQKIERTVVKYKKLIPGSSVAWLKASVVEKPGDLSPADFLRQRRIPEAGWKIVKEIEDGLKINGYSAARITFGGPFDPNSRGAKDYQSEVVVVRRGKQLICFSGTFAAGNTDDRDEIRKAIESAVFDRNNFTAGQ